MSLIGIPAISLRMVSKVLVAIGMFQIGLVGVTLKNRFYKASGEIKTTVAGFARIQLVQNFGESSYESGCFFLPLT